MIIFHLSREDTTKYSIEATTNYAGARNGTPAYEYS
jgi:hypothetical protein